MIAFIVTTITCFITYLLITTGRIFVKEDFRMLNHVRRLTFIAYAIARATHKSGIEPVSTVMDSFRKTPTKKSVKRKKEVKE